MSVYFGLSRSKLQRDQDRDISELIALGQPNPRTSSEAQYDQRLFNQNKVINPSAFANLRLLISGQ